jgi:hypothetical protein
VYGATSTPLLTSFVELGVGAVTFHFPVEPLAPGDDGALDPIGGRGEGGCVEVVVGTDAATTVVVRAVVVADRGRAVAPRWRGAAGVFKITVLTVVMSFGATGTSRSTRRNGTDQATSWLVDILRRAMGFRG